MSKTSSHSCSARPHTSIPILGTVVALALALVSLLPGQAAARLVGNRNQTMLRAGAPRKHLGTVLALGLALVAMLPALAAAKLAGNHNQTILRDAHSRS